MADTDWKYGTILRRPTAGEHSIGHPDERVMFICAAENPGVSGDIGFVALALRGNPNGGAEEIAGGYWSIWWEEADE